MHHPWTDRICANIVWRLDETAAVEVERLGRVLAVADVRCSDGDHLDHGLEDGCAHVGAGWQTNEDDCSSWSYVLCECQPCFFFEAVEILVPLRLAGMASLRWQLR